MSSQTKAPLRFADYYRRLDSLASPVSLSIGGNDTLQTSFGATLSLLRWAILMWLIITISSSFFRTDEPRINVEVDTKFDPPQIDLVQSKQLPIIYAFNGQKHLVAAEAKKYLTVAVQLLVQSKLADSEEFNFSLDSHTAYGVPCSELGESSRFRRMFGELSEYDLHYGICLDLGTQDYHAKGKIGPSAAVDAPLQGRKRQLIEDIFDQTIFSIFPCSLETGCDTSHSVSDINVNFARKSPVFRSSDKAVPLTYEPDSDENIHFLPDFTHYFRSRLMVNEVWDSQGLFSSDRQRASYISVDSLFQSTMSRQPSKRTCSKQEIETLNCKAYYTHSFISSGKTFKYKRSYRSIEELLGELGGLQEVVTLMFLLLYSHYNQYAAKRLLLSKVFAVHDLSPLKFLGCRKKKTSSVDSQKTKNSLSLEDKEDIALAAIDRHLDVVSLLRELVVLKFVSLLLLRDSQKRAIPALSLIMDQSERLKIVTPQRDSEVEEALSTMGNYQDFLGPDCQWQQHSYVEVDRLCCSIINKRKDRTNNQSSTSLSVDNPSSVLSILENKKRADGKVSENLDQVLGLGVYSVQENRSQPMKEDESRRLKIPGHPRTDISLQKLYLQSQTKKQ